MAESRCGRISHVVRPSESSEASETSDDLRFLLLTRLEPPEPEPESVDAAGDTCGSLAFDGER